MIAGRFWMGAGLASSIFMWLFASSGGPNESGASAFVVEPGFISELKFIGAGRPSNATGYYSAPDVFRL